MSVSSIIPGSLHNSPNLKNWESFRSQVSLDIPSQDEFISEVRRPSLLSVTLSDSVCSNSSLDCNDPNNQEFEEEPVKDTDVPLKQNNRPYKINKHHVHQKSYKTKNFLEVSKKPLEVEDLKVSRVVSDPTQKPSIVKSLSMHDVSGISGFTLGLKQNSAASCETIHSQSLSSTTKSKDSGFHRSVSCLSLNSGSRSYDHVQSKVKEYIRGIKEREAQRKKHYVGKQHSGEKPESTSVNIDTLDTEDLVETISKMELELKEKSVLLDTQQKNYNALLKKLAEAENTIDQLRLRRSSNFYDSYHSSRDSLLYNSQPYGYLNSSSNPSLGASMEKVNLLQPKPISKDSTKGLISNNVNSLCNNKNSSNRNSISPSIIRQKAEVFSPNRCSTPSLESAQQNELRPVTRLFSSSCRLDRTFTPLAKMDDANSNFDYSSKKSESQNRSKSEHRGALDQSEESLYSNKNCVQQRRKKVVKGLGNHIDLPKVDPFDKVKKWQASLPSIHLLGYDHSASNSDVGDSGLKSPRLVKTLNKTENQQVSKTSLLDVNVTASGVGRFTKSEQDLSHLKSFFLNDRHLKNTSVSAVKKQKNWIPELKSVVSSPSQKYMDLSLPVYLSTYQPKEYTLNNEVKHNSDNIGYSGLRNKYYNALSMKSDDSNNNKHDVTPFSQYHVDHTSHQMHVNSQTKLISKQSHVNCMSANCLNTKCLYTTSSYNSNCYNNSINIEDSKHDLISHCYLTTEISDYQKHLGTTVFDRGHTKSGTNIPVKRNLNSSSVIQSVSEFSVSERSENIYVNRDDHKTDEMLTCKLHNCIITERPNSEDSPSVSSSVLSSLNEYNYETPSRYKNSISPKRKKCIGSKDVPNKIKKLVGQEQSTLPVVEAKSRSDNYKQLVVNSSKYIENTLEHPKSIHNSEIRKCKKHNKNDLKSAFVNHYKTDQGTKKHLTTDKLMEERNFLYAKQTPLPVDDLENELLNDIYTGDKSLKDSLKDSQYFAHLMSVRLRKMKKELEDIQSETQQG